MVKGFGCELPASGRLSDFGWSSYPLYLDSPKRPEWLETGRVLGCLGLADDPSGVAAYRDFLEKRVLEMACSETPWNVDERWADVRRDGVYGSERFRESMQERLDEVMAGGKRCSYSGEEVRRHDERDTRRLLEEYLREKRVDCLEPAHGTGLEPIPPYPGGGGSNGGPSVGSA